MQRMFCLLVLCAFTAVNAQLLSGPKPAPYMTDSTTGKQLLMDFNIKLTGIKDANMPFSVFSSRPLLIYYFSPFCPHCQKSFPGVQQLAKGYEQKGLASLAVSIGSVGKRDILMFMEERNASMPFFQDADGEFSKKYGDGYVPRLYLVHPDGKIVRYTSLESEQHMKEIKADIDKLLGLSK